MPSTPPPRAPPSPHSHTQAEAGWRDVPMAAVGGRRRWSSAVAGGDGGWRRRSASSASFFPRAALPATRRGTGGWLAGWRGKTNPQGSAAGGALIGRARPAPGRSRPAVRVRCRAWAVVASRELTSLGRSGLPPFFGANTAKPHPDTAHAETARHGKAGVGSGAVECLGALAHLHRGCPSTATEYALTSSVCLSPSPRPRRLRGVQSTVTQGSVGRRPGRPRKPALVYYSRYDGDFASSAGPGSLCCVSPKARKSVRDRDRSRGSFCCMLELLFAPVR